MKSGNIAVKILIRTIIVISMLVVVIVVVKGASKAYSFGYAVFMDEAIDTEENAREVTVTVSEGDSALDIGKMLERRGLIQNAYVFYIQSYCYEAGRKLEPGSYDLTTDMNGKEIMTTMVTQNSKENQK